MGSELLTSVLTPGSELMRCLDINGLYSLQANVRLGFNCSHDSFLTGSEL